MCEIGRLGGGEDTPGEITISALDPPGKAGAENRRAVLRRFHAAIRRDSGVVPPGGRRTRASVRGYTPA